MGIVLTLIAIGIALVVVGLVVHGLFNLLIIGVVVFVLSVIYGAVRSRRTKVRSRR